MGKCFIPSATQISLMMASTDRAALGALFRSTGGESWDRKDNWVTDTELATWHGAQVNDQGRIVALDLSTNNLRGSLNRSLDVFGTHGLVCSWSILCSSLVLSRFREIPHFNRFRQDSPSARRLPVPPVYAFLATLSPSAWAF